VRCLCLLVEIELVDVECSVRESSKVHYCCELFVPNDDQIPFGNERRKAQMG